MRRERQSCREIRTEVSKLQGAREREREGQVDTETQRERQLEMGKGGGLQGGGVPAQTFSCLPGFGEWEQVTWHGLPRQNLSSSVAMDTVTQSRHSALPPLGVPTLLKPQTGPYCPPVARDTTAPGFIYSILETNSDWPFVIQMGETEAQRQRRNWPDPYTTSGFLQGDLTGGN